MYWEKRGERECWEKSFPNQLLSVYCKCPEKKLCHTSMKKYTDNIMTYFSPGVSFQIFLW